MDLYAFLVGLYSTFLSLFPAPVQWLVTFVVLIGLIAGFWVLVRHNWLFIILLVLLLPVFIPILQHFFSDLYNFFLYLLSILGVAR